MKMFRNKNNSIVETAVINSNSQKKTDISMFNYSNENIKK